MTILVTNNQNNNKYRTTYNQILLANFQEQIKEEENLNRQKILKNKIKIIKIKTKTTQNHLKNKNNSYKEVHIKDYSPKIFLLFPTKILNNRCSFSKDYKNRLIDYPNKIHNYN